MPIIDLKGFDVNDEASVARVAAEIGAACREVGFFYVINHGVEQSLVEDVFAQSKSFFAKPLAEKLEVSMDKVGGNRGYIKVMGEVLDHSLGPDNKEAFHSGLELAADDPEVLAKKPFRVLNAWPRDMPVFREKLVTYYNECSALGLRISRALAHDLGLPADFFANKFTRPMGALRILHYPHGNAEHASAPGAGEHTDWGHLTLLVTDDVGGLEIKNRAGQWLAAPVIPNAFVVNIGDQLMRWTNDIYVSTPHRVVQPPRERYSVAFFYDPNPESLLESIPSCIPHGEKPKYEPMSSGEYLQQRFTRSLPGEYKQLY